jgi:antitoxin (DNA-binding transcriptional repressor) of toxin-antitoxin stability system
MVRMSATEVARNFSAVINRVGAGEDIEIVRNGATVAELRRPSHPQRLKGDAWRRFVATLPVVDEQFARDVEEARANIGSPVSKWSAG